MDVKAESKIWNEALWKSIEGHDALNEKRSLAWNAFVSAGFPNKKNESWRYTSLNSLMAGKFQFPERARPDKRILDYLRGRIESFKGYARLVFLDGFFVPQISDITALTDEIDFSNARELAVHRAHALAIETKKMDAFAAMNVALMQDGVWLNVHARAKPTVPLLIYFLQTAEEKDLTVQLKHWISLAAGSELKIVEWHDQLSDAPLFLNQQMQIQLGSDSQLQHVRIQQGSRDAWMLSASDVTLEKKSRYERLDLELGALVSRNEIRATFLNGESFCGLKGIGLGAGAQHFDTQVTMAHAVPNASSSQTYRNLLAGKARGVFGGRVRVQKDAQKTDASQAHKTLLLSKEARADTQPQLEIDADDVKCSHGAAIGQLDEDSLFYLQSRGINRSQAEKILAAGFVEQLLGAIPDESLRFFLLKQIEEKLTQLF